MTPTDQVADHAAAPDDEQLVAVEQVSFLPEPVSAGQARKVLRDVLAKTDRSDWADAAELALSEVVTNAVLHARTAFEVTIEVFEHHLMVQVRDGSPALPEQREYAAPATTGRGMALVAAVSQACGVHHLGGEGKVVWFCMDDAAQPPSEAPDLAEWDIDADDDELPMPGDSATSSVHLRQIPATLWLAARQHHEAMLRELLLHVADDDQSRTAMHPAEEAHSLISTVIQRAVERSQRSGTAVHPLPDGHPSTLPLVPPDLSIRVDLPADSGPGFALLQDALDSAERLAVEGKLLMHPGLPEIVAVRDWVCDQVVAQLAGVAAAPWAGTALEQFETAAHGRDDDDLGWDDSLVVNSLQGVVAADQANRIVAVSRPLADVLGWRVEDLVGRRVVTLIPPALREAHVAGFSRHLTTGQAHILGVPITLPVLHADGHEVQCQVLVERAHHGNRAMYLAWMEPLPET